MDDVYERLADALEAPEWLPEDAFKHRDPPPEEDVFAKGSVHCQQNGALDRAPESIGRTVRVLSREGRGEADGHCRTRAQIKIHLFHTLFYTLERAEKDLERSF